ncbi:hypothetical protein FQA47_018576 [Oryzias melastigma]|uniref:Uncharacterized protein n=1 Tax=Oryzias melastigma TaxID=30732 RepID=A0A834BVT1_ORYME|nr:hypothetical protein FQA47_018576 [Oryzias melastigma]
MLLQPLPPLPAHTHAAFLLVDFPAAPLRPHNDEHIESGVGVLPKDSSAYGGDGAGGQSLERTVDLNRINIYEGTLNSILENSCLEDAGSSRCSQTAPERRASTPARVPALTPNLPLRFWSSSTRCGFLRLPGTYRRDPWCSVSIVTSGYEEATRPRCNESAGHGQMMDVETTSYSDFINCDRTGRRNAVPRHLRRGEIRAQHKRALQRHGGDGSEGWRRKPRILPSPPDRRLHQPRHAGRGRPVLNASCTLKGAAAKCGEEAGERCIQPFSYRRGSPIRPELTRTINMCRNKCASLWMGV